MLSTIGGFSFLWVRRSIRFRFSSNLGSLDCFQVSIDWWLMSASSNTMRSRSIEIESTIRRFLASSLRRERDHWE